MGKIDTKKQFAIATLGCKVNQFETADMIEQLKSDGWHLVGFGEPADLCIINTCTVTARSDAESRRLIRRARRNNPQARIVVTGCYAQVAPHELELMPEVDLLLGNNEKQSILYHLKQGTHQITDLKSLKESGTLRLTSFAEHTRAFVQVQTGCEAFCAYCIVPFARGPSRSAEPDAIISTVKRLADRGFQEVVLTGIHLGLYGADLSPPVTLAELVSRLLDSKNRIPRLRLGSIEPNELSDMLLSLLSSSPNICPHLHIPLQSGSDSVLRRMGRKYDSSFYRSRIEQAAAFLPEAFIAADVITGFPGETELEFMETCRLIEALPLANLHIFPYSRRAGTRAALMEGHLQSAVIKRRAELLRKIAAAKLDTFQQRFTGRCLPVLGQKYDFENSLMTGLSRNYLEVVYNSATPLLNLESVVQIDKQQYGRLYGRCKISTHKQGACHDQFT